MQIQDHDFMTDGRDMTVKIFDYERSMILEGITEVFLPGPNLTKILVSEGQPTRVYRLDKDQRHIEIWTNKGETMEVSILGGGSATVTESGVFVYSRGGFLFW